MKHAEHIPKKEGILVTIGMQKGGVAKSTNATHLAAALGERGKRVLLWDIDENHGATKIFGIPPNGFQTTWNVLKGDSSATEAIIEFDDLESDVELPENVDFIPSSRALEGIDAELTKADRFFNPNEILIDHIRNVRALNRYDYILLDTGPTASPTIRGALLTSDFYILSCVPEKLCIESLGEALTDIQNAKRPGRNENMVLIGLILSCMDRRKNLAKEYERKIQQQFLDAEQNSVKFNATISSAAAIEKAYEAQKTLLQFEPNHKVSHQYRELAEEFEQRVGQHYAPAETYQEPQRELANA